MIFAQAAAARISFGCPEEIELRAHPDIREIVGKNVAEGEFRKMVKKVAGINGTIRHDAELSHASCAADTLRQGMLFKAGSMDRMDIYAQVLSGSMGGKFRELDKAGGNIPGRVSL